MTSHSYPLALFFLASLLLSACSEQEAPPPTEGAATAATGAPGADAAGTRVEDFNTTATIRDVMNTLVDPHADALWSAVRYEITEAGVEEYFPRTEAEWQALRASAIAMIEGANALMIPGRRVAAPGSGTEFPDYEYLPDEVAQRLEQDWRSWVGFAQGFQQAAIGALEAIENRDVDGLTEIGAAIDQTCESCHGQYWYRSQ